MSPEYVSTHSLPPIYTVRINGELVDFSNKIYTEAMKDLKDLLGREPTKKELDDFLIEMRGDTPQKVGQLDPFGFGLERSNAKYNWNDAIKGIREITGRTPSDNEINDWLYEMNEPFSHEQLYLDAGLPGYSEVYHSDNDGSLLSYNNIFFVLLAVGMAGLAYKWRKRRDQDDEFAKVDSETPFINRLKNPFKRKDDNDDDFDKVL